MPTLSGIRRGFTLGLLSVIAVLVSGGLGFLTVSIVGDFFFGPLAGLVVFILALLGFGVGLNRLNLIPIKK